MPGSGYAAALGHDQAQYQMHRESLKREKYEES